MSKTAEHWTYADYKNWPEGERWEFVHSEACMLSSPSWDHQTILANLSQTIMPIFKGKPCKARFALIDVFVEYAGDFSGIDENLDAEDTVLEPDFIVVCDEKKIHRHGVLGAPDLVIEILSNNTARRDWNVKYNLYENAGVRKYWVVDPASRTIYVFAHDGKVFVEKAMRTEKGTVASAIFPDLRFEISDLWDGML